MTNFSNILLEDFFKVFISIYLTKDGFIKFTAVTGSVLLSPYVFAKAVTKLGFTKAGITAGSIAAWMMSLHRGYVPAGGPVSTLQSVGASGLGFRGTAACLGGALGVAVVIAIKKESETFLIIKCENNEHPIVILEINVKSNENKKLLSILEGFVLAQKVVEKRVRHFKFIIGEGSDILQSFLVDKYGSAALTLTQNGFLLILRDFSSKI
ncbi:6904_t:CDS:1 [Acaulospora morrowiae]|uniref:6904_t:CDS:1 n=1 Tax=Acaulospora morrowiae TaxID=94023 RepID=A0A9N9GNS3_9GLOM|nr:6904_t:CDS:1 [Acaulospora morrowiae]